jgi:16S rRNA (cytidine1402-2'-O)-methyltransferase
MLNGESIALISDAGTPGINDPGFRLVTAGVENGIEVISVPGPSAVITAIAASGLPTDSIFFGGFLPSKKNERRARFRQVNEIPSTLVFYESPRRLKAALADALDKLGDRRAVIARELTKLHEEFLRGRLSELIDRLQNREVKGEIVLMIDRSSGENSPKNERSTLSARVNELVSGGIDRKAALKQAAKEFGLSRSEAYRELQSAKNL